MSKNKQKNKKNNPKTREQEITQLVNYAEKIALEYTRFFSAAAMLDENPPIPSLFDIIDSELMMAIIQKLEDGKHFKFNKESKLTMEEQYLLSMHLESDMARNHVILAIARNEKAWKWIDIVYQENKSEYYSLYKETFFYTSEFKQIFPTKTKEYINKMAGIDAWCRLNGSNTPLYRIIQKNYNKIYSMFKSGIKEINLDSHCASRLKNFKGKCHTKEAIAIETELEAEMMIAILLGFEFDTMLKPGLWESITREYSRELFEGIDARVGNMLILDNITEEQYENVLKRFFDITPKEVKKCQSLHDFFQIVDARQLELARENYYAIRNLKQEPVIELSKEINNAIFSDMKNSFVTDDMFYKAIESCAANISSSIETTITGKMINSSKRAATFAGLSKEVLKDMPITEEIIKIAIFLNCTIENNLTIKDMIEGDSKISQIVKLSAINYVISLSMLEHYKQYKPSFFSEEAEEMVSELIEKDLKIKEKDAEIEKLKRQLEEAEQRRVRELDEVLADLNNSAKNISKLEKELKLSNENEKEFNALKELVYRNSIEESETALTDEIIDINFMLDYLSGRKIIIFGGHPNWVNKLKKYLPDVKYIDAEKYSSYSFNNLENYDLLAICTNYIGHGLIYKISEAIKSIQSKKVVMVDDINTEKVISTMYDSLIEFEENNN
jgi:hypothetical protein